MPICIECQYPVKTLWTKYNTGGASGSSSGHNIRLTVCKNCGRFCDKYVEHDFVVLFIDLVLIKPQVYRHLLHNTLMRETNQFDPSMIRLGILLLLFDVYLTWARIEKQTLPDLSSSEISSGGSSKLGRLSKQPIWFQYLFFLILCTLSTLVFHLSIRFLTSSPWSPLVLLRLFYISKASDRPAASSAATAISPASSSSAKTHIRTTNENPPLSASSSPSSCSSCSSSSSSSSTCIYSSENPPRHDSQMQNQPPHPRLLNPRDSLPISATGSPPLPSPNAVSTALLVSSSTKLFPILMVIWDYDIPAAARSLGWAVVANNVEALKILLDCRYPVAFLLAAVGATASWTVEYAVLWTMGLEGVDVAAGGGIWGDWRALGGFLWRSIGWVWRLVFEALGKRT